MLYKITYFTRDLVSPTKEEVQYRRATTVSDAISVALEYDCSNYCSGAARSNVRWEPHRGPDLSHQASSLAPDPSLMSPKLARCLTFFAQFHFTLYHVHGSLNVVVAHSVGFDREFSRLRASARDAERRHEQEVQEARHEHREQRRDDLFMALMAKIAGSGLQAFYCTVQCCGQSYDTTVQL